MQDTKQRPAPLIGALGTGPVWALESFTTPGIVYLVAITPAGTFCSCPARVTCKHIRRVQEAIEGRQI